MFIDYLTLMLVNMAAGFVLLACFLIWELGTPENKGWAPVFGITGLVASISGFAMSFTWPLPKPYNPAFGEMSVLFGVLFLGAAWSLSKGWDLTPLGIYALLAGIAAVIVGVRIIHLGLTASPIMSGVGFILSGLAGVMAWVILRMRKVMVLRIFAAFLLLVTAGIWAMTGYGAYWQHLKV